MEKYELKPLHPHSFTMTSAVKCNLRCDYCTLDKTLNSKSEQLFKDTVEALQNGVYLENTKKVFKRLQESPKNIDVFQIWGQEPTLILPYLTEYWKDWQEFFPNLNRTFFSTNAMQCVDEIYNFILEVDKYAKNKIRMEIQVSYDGAIGVDKVRKGKSDLIKENIYQLILKLNSTILKNVNVVFCFHGVVSHEIFNNLKTFEQLDEYFTEIDNFINKVSGISTNKRVENTNLTLLLVNGAEFTTEDGQSIASFTRKVNALKQIKHYNYFDHCDDFCFEILGPVGYNTYEDILNGKYENLDDYINTKYNHEGDMRQVPSCIPLFGDLKIMYNGDITFCQNSIHDTNIEEDKLNDSIFDQSRKFQMRNVKTNLVTDSDEEIEHFINIVSEYTNGGTSKTYLNEIMNYLYLMAQCGQVDRAYLTDFKKLKRHSLLITFLNTCYWNLSIKTGSPTIRNIQDIRAYGNGILDIFEEGMRRAENERKKRQ